MSDSRRDCPGRWRFPLPAPSSSRRWRFGEARRPTCWRHSKPCIIEHYATGLHAAANTMPRWKRPEGSLVQRTRGLIWAQVFGRHIVLRDFFGVNFRHVCVGCVFHAADDFGFEGLAFLDQFLDALRACLRYVRQSLCVPGLAGRTRTHSLLGSRNGTVRSEFFIVWLLHTLSWCT